MYKNEDLLKMKDPQFVFVYNGLKKGQVFNEMLGTSLCYGEFVTKSGIYTMQTMASNLPVVLYGGDCNIQGQVYKVRHEVFRQLVGFHYGHVPVKIKVSGFKKRVWIWVLTSDSKFVLKMLDKPVDNVYNWGSTTETVKPPAVDKPKVEERKTMAHTNVTPITKTPEPVKPYIPTTYTPIKHKKGNPTVFINKDIVTYKLLTLFDALESDIWDSKIDNAERGDRCKKNLEGMREVTKELVKVYG